MSTTKAVNYTPEQVQTMREKYEAAENAEAREAVVVAIAAEFGKSKRSIISKMSRENFYIKKVAVSKVTGAKPQKKDELANTLRFVSGMVLVSAEKLNKTDLQDLIEYFEGLQVVTEGFAENETEAS